MPQYSRPFLLLLSPSAIIGAHKMSVFDIVLTRLLFPLYRRGPFYCNVAIMVEFPESSVPLIEGYTLNGTRVLNMIHVRSSSTQAGATTLLIIIFSILSGGIDEDIVPRDAVEPYAVCW